RRDGCVRAPDPAVPSSARGHSRRETQAARRLSVKAGAGGRLEDGTPSKGARRMALMGTAPGPRNTSSGTPITTTTTATTTTTTRPKPNRPLPYCRPLMTALGVVVLALLPFASASAGTGAVAFDAPRHQDLAGALGPAGGFAVATGNNNPGTRNAAVADPERRSRAEQAERSARFLLTVDSSSATTSASDQVPTLNPTATPTGGGDDDDEGAASGGGGPTP
ncbi:unnamed protein product, partial [Scytosiphon promiscuus]